MSEQPQAPQSIRGIVPHKCPECGKDLMISFAMHPPTMGAIYTPESAEKAKKAVLERLEEIKFKSEDEKQMALNWINDPQTVFGMEDIEPLLKNIAMNQLENKTDEKPAEEKPKV